MISQVLLFLCRLFGLTHHYTLHTKFACCQPSAALRSQRESFFSPLVTTVGTVVMAAAIPVHPVGSQGFKASAQGLGCMGMSSFYKDIDHQATEKESIAVIHRAIELGVTLLDTSDIYGMLMLPRDPWAISRTTCLSLLACCRPIHQ